MAPRPWTGALAVGGGVLALSLADAAIACSRSSAAVGLSGGAAAIALATSFGALFGCGLALVAELALRVLTRWRAVQPRLAPAFALALLCVIAWAVLRGLNWKRIDVRAIDPWMVIAAVIFAPTVALLFAVLKRRSQAALLAIACAALGLGALGVLGFTSSSPASRSLALGAIDDRSVILKPLVQRASRELDFDRDGHPQLLCGESCDCDDFNAGIFPLSIDIPGNQRDEDCDGRDATQAEHDALARLTGRSGAPASHALPLENTRVPDVLLIVIDTLRADHLGLYGYKRPTSPRIDALGKRAVVFEQARSTGPSTRFSMPPMLASKWFTEIARNNYEWPAISENEHLLGEYLRDEGYTLAAFHSIRYFRAYFKLGQGFHHWSDRALDERAPELRMISSDFITDEALAWADKQLVDKQLMPARKPFLLWTYYGDPHAEYMRHPGFPSFGSERADRYDGEIAFTDHHVGRLLDGLQQRGLTDNLLVILTSDHGEALDVKADHGALNHSKHLYDELLHVPLLIAGPGFAPRRVSTPVSLLDILPTLLELAKADDTPSDMPSDTSTMPPALRGTSLVPWLRGESPEHPPLFFEKHRAIDDPQKGMLAWPYKVIVTVPTGRTQIYDLSSDPREQRDLYSSLAPAERHRLTSMFKHWAANVLKPARDNWRH